MRLSYGVVHNNAILPRAPATKNKFLTCSFSLHFLCDLMRMPDCRKLGRAAARLLQDTQRCSYTYRNRSHSHTSTANATRLLHDYPADDLELYCTAVASMLRTIQLPMKFTRLLHLRQSCKCEAHRLLISSGVSYH